MLESNSRFDAETSVEIPKQRHVYRDQSANQLVDFPFKKNRPVKRRKRSPLDMIFLLFSISIVVVFYIWNKIIVNRLVVDVNDLQTQHQKIMNENEILRSEITKKTSLERIETIAARQLGLTYPKEQSVWFEVDIERAERVLQNEK